MTREFCPQCATARAGQLRYCRRCAFDFDAPDGADASRPLSYQGSAPPAPASASWGAPPAAPARGRPKTFIRLTLGINLLALVALIAYLLLTR